MRHIKVKIVTSEDHKISTMPVKTEEEFVEESTTHMTNGGGKTLASAETNTAGSGHRKSKVGNSGGVE